MRALEPVTRARERAATADELELLKALVFRDEEGEQFDHLKHERVEQLTVRPAPVRLVLVSLRAILQRREHGRSTLRALKPLQAKEDARIAKMKAQLGL